jgi:hypothetical protein
MKENCEAVRNKRPMGIEPTAPAWKTDQVILGTYQMLGSICINLH